MTQTRVLTVGAYERDNFGDLLFLLLTERYLAGSTVVASAPFAADMTALLDRPVVALADELTDRDVDVVWTVGGQVGGTSPESALRMSKSPAEFGAYLEAEPARQRELIRSAFHGVSLASPYVPTPGAFARNAGAVTVLNSVGLAGADGLPLHVREEVVEVLRTTDVVSVRDVESSRFLDRIDVAHTLAPDVVHALSLLDPYEPDPDSDIAVVQFSTRLLERFGHRRLARILVRSPHLAGLRLRFLMAGVAEGHDSLEGLERVAEHIRKLDPQREIEVLTDRRPLDIVRQIREARVVIGTSLHVRIVAATYGVPRVTMRRTKPTRYAAHWDELMPYDVRPGQLDDAIGAALAAGRRPEVRAASDRLSALADANVRTIVERVQELVERRPDADRQRLAERRRERHEEISTRREACAVATDGIRSELAAATHELELVRAELELTRAELELARTDAARQRRRTPITLRRG